jgi:hypothetical protein
MGPNLKLNWSGWMGPSQGLSWWGRMESNWKLNWTGNEPNLKLRWREVGPSQGLK